MASDAEVMSEVKDLIRFYTRRGWNWLLAAEYTIWKHTSSEVRKDGYTIFIPYRRSQP